MGELPTARDYVNVHLPGTKSSSAAVSLMVYRIGAEFITTDAKRAAPTMAPSASPLLLVAETSPPKYSFVSARPRSLLVHPGGRGVAVAWASGSVDGATGVPLGPAPVLPPSVAAPGATPGAVVFPVSMACAPAPAKGNANKPAARITEREIEVMAVSFPITAIFKCGASTKRASLYSVVDTAMRHTRNRRACWTQLLRKP